MRYVSNNSSSNHPEHFCTVLHACYPQSQIQEICRGWRRNPIFIFVTSEIDWADSLKVDVQNYSFSFQLSIILDNERLRGVWFYSELAWFDYVRCAFEPRAHLIRVRSPLLMIVFNLKGRLNRVPKASLLRLLRLSHSLKAIKELTLKVYGCVIILFRIISSTSRICNALHLPDARKDLSVVKLVCRCAVEPATAGRLWGCLHTISQWVVRNPGTLIIRWLAQELLWLWYELFLLEVPFTLSANDRMPRVKHLTELHLLLLKTRS